MSREFPGRLLLVLGALSVAALWFVQEDLGAGQVGALLAGVPLALVLTGVALSLLARTARSRNRD